VSLFGREDADPDTTPMAMFKRLIDAVTLGSEHPLRRLIAYYAILLVAVVLGLLLYPGAQAILMDGDAVTSGVSPTLLQDGLSGPGIVAQALGPGSLGELVISTLLVIFGIVALMLPVTWVYMSARRVPGHDQSVVQTLLILPIVVAGIVIIVQNSLALAFSLAGVVAAVRFRTTLDDTRDVVFIFLAIGVGFAGGVHMLAIGTIISVAFNLITLLTWQYDFGRNMLQPTAASQWSEPLKDLAKPTNGDGGGVPDRDVMLALTPKKAEELAKRIERVRAVLGNNKKKPRFDSVLSITSDKVSEAQEILQKVLDKMTKRWVLDEVVTNVGKPSEVYYLIRLGQSTTCDELVTAIRAKAGDRVSAVDVELGVVAAKAKNGSSA
jgi:hypothetical protein